MVMVYSTDFIDSSSQMKQRLPIDREQERLRVETAADRWKELAGKIFDEPEKAALVSLVDRKAKGILNTLDFLQKTSSRPENIRARISESLKELDLSARLFCRNREKYMKRQESVNEKNKKIQDDIHSLQTDATTEFEANEEKPLERTLYEHMMDKVSYFEWY